MPLILTELLSKLRNWCRPKTFFSFLLPIHDFHEQNNSFGHLNSVHCKHSALGIDVVVIRVAQQQKPKFSLPWEFVTDRTSVRNLRLQNYDLQNADSLLLMSAIICSILTLFTSCKHSYQYYIGIIWIFEQLRLFLIFSKHMCPPDAARLKRRGLHDFTRN